MKNFSIVLILHNIRSAHNVGSIFRTADAVGVSKIYLCGYTPTPSKSAIRPLENCASKVPTLGGGPTEWGAKELESLSRAKSRGSRVGRMADLPDKISKTALGAEKIVSWEQYKQTWRLLRKLRDDGLLLIALEQAKNSVNIFKLKSIGHKPLALILGNEVSGLSGQILKYANKIIAIPMYGQKESLNVSVAAGIALYKIIEKKTPKSRSLIS